MEATRARWPLALVLRVAVAPPQPRAPKRLPALATARVDVSDDAVLDPQLLHDIKQSRGWPMDERYTRQTQLIAPVFVSEDAREGAAAFAEKRAPNWKGK